MSTLLLSCQCDSVVTNICRSLIPVVKETYGAGTNEQDVHIVFIICVAIIIVVLIFAITFIAWKYKEINMKIKEQVDQITKEKEDSERKIKNDLLDKYLDLLKENASKDNKWIQDYKEVLISFKEAIQNETKESSFMNYNINSSDKDKMISILEKQMEFLKAKGFESNAEAEKEYQQALAYLIELFCKSEMGKITKKELLGESN